MIQIDEFNLCLVPRPKLVFDVLRCPEALKRARLDHDAHFRRECVCFLHGMGRQDDTRVLSFFGNVRDYFPHKLLGSWVHSSWWLVEENDLRVAQDGDCCLKLPFVASRERISWLVNVLVDIQLLYNNFNKRILQRSGKAFKIGVKVKVLSDGDSVEQGLLLGAVAEQIPDALEVFC